MIRSTGFTGSIIKGDIIINRVYERVKVSEKDLITLLERTYAIVAISFDGWISINNISMFTINGKWAGPDIKIYHACFDFIKIRGNYSGKNLTKLVFTRGRQLSILPKIISLTRDNAKNNNTYARHLYTIISYYYNEHLDLMPLHSQYMRFKGEESLVDYIAHVNNLVVKAILKSLGSSTYQDAYAFLDRVKVYG